MCNGLTKFGSKCKNKQEPYCHLHMSTTILPISSFICTLIANKKCSTIGLNISNSLIKVAVTRIFAEPEQSIIELIANSIDSYNLSKKIYPVGKFGMGFFSILYWINEHYSRYIIITSKTPYEDKYSIKLQWTNRGLYIEEIESDKNGDSGTEILLVCNDNPFTYFNLINFEKNVNKLFYAKSANIIYNSKSINNSKSLDYINIILSPTLLKITDNALGLSKEVLYNSLLVPSVSTKQNSILKQNISSFKILKSDSNSLHIILNEISVVNIYIDNLKNIDTLKYFDNKKYIIVLPSNSALPVGRDDIIYGNVESDALKTQILNIVYFIIDTSKNLIPFILLLDEYCKKNNSNALHSIVMEVKNKIVNNNNIILLPYNKSFDVYKILKIKNGVYYPNPNMYITETKLLKYLNKISLSDILKLKHIITIDMPISKIYDNGGLINFIFVNQKYIKKNPIQWLNNLILSNTDMILYPVNSEFVININTIQLKHLDILKILKSVWIRKFSPLNIYRSDESGNTTLSDDKLFNSYIEEIIYKIQIYLNDNEKLIEFITYFINKLSNVKIKFTYGNKKKLNIDFFPIFNIYTITNTLFNKFNLRKLNSILIDIKYKLLMYYLDNIPNILDSYNKTIYNINTFLLSNFEGVCQQIIDEMYLGLMMCSLTIEYYIFFIITIIFINKYNTNIYKKNQSILGIGNFLATLIKNNTDYFDFKYNIVTYMKIIKPIYIKIEEYYNNSINIASTVLKEINYTYKFTCKTLLYFIYDNKELPLNYLEELTILNKTYKEDDMKLQIIDIAVNSGTTKSYIDSIITELFQNSLDAIRGSKTKNNKIEFLISSNSIEIKDYVGFNYYIPLLIPFLSSKNPDDANNTGEMGSGFFNLYRYPHTKSVKIESVYNKVYTSILCIPIIKNSKVVDIEYNINTKASIKENSTRIIVLLNENEFLIDNIVNANIFIKNYMGIIDNIWLNEKQIIKKITPIYLDKNIGEVKYIDTPLQKSFVMTNGVPFLPLEEFCANFPNVYKNFIKLGEVNIVINFYKNVYTPTQSRTKVSIADSKIQLITKFINDGLYYAILYGYYTVHKLYLNSIQFTSSTSSIRQLYLPTKNTYNNFPTKDIASTVIKDLVYNYEVNNSKISTEINKVRSLVSSDKNLINLDNLDTLLKATYNDIIYNVLNKWFGNKDLNRINITITDNKYFKSKYLNIFITEYWRLLKLRNIDGIILSKSAPTIYISNIDDRLNGFYRNGEIHLNSKYFNDSDLTEELDICKKHYEKIIYFNTNSLLQKYFNIIISTTLIHEIGHAILNTNHTDLNSHGLVSIKINNEELEFDDFCIEIYKMLINEGLIINFLELIKKL